MSASAKTSFLSAASLAASSVMAAAKAYAPLPPAGRHPLDHAADPRVGDLARARPQAVAAPAVVARRPYHAAGGVFRAVPTETSPRG